MREAESMTTYRARLMDAATGGEGVYEFEDDESLIKQTPVRIIRRFMEHVGNDLIPHAFRDYELNAAFKNEHADIVTGLGSLILAHGPALPFVIMIARKRADAG
ncbi:MAG: hypothetical protein CMM50_10980 [Rhodospirillaceae bacterium]|nr:hypothetical protein [Rhodospirillaceae bacterium]|tara:strand:- start:76 stop:387 length:312 start_codon:yes stop_codon:yes gene_type:complete